ncbi:hypothetical protein NC99_17600 [Sunxiuqinia dokdonensis]|uniref:Uncharacterized protein n=1 Tax=Sunxiuqinia dokdonensis TaxID=1409788 RepID=A0A0L8VAP5_9BACT|nr:hypothetical protein NC99_17600 [Sunxiuqinia dokdonensis]
MVLGMLYHLASLELKAKASNNLIRESQRTRGHHNQAIPSKVLIL